jgi:acyl carrier protein
MDNIRKQKIKAYFLETFRQQNDDQSLADNDSLFVSGRLDSFSMMMFVMYLEKEFGIDFAAIDFDVNLIDSLSEIELLIDSHISV